MQVRLSRKLRGFIIFRFILSKKKLIFRWDNLCPIHCFRAFARFVSFKTHALRTRLESTTNTAGFQEAGSRTKENINMKNTKITAARVISLVLAIASITFIITSMVLDKTTPYLAIGLSLLAISNIINWSSKDGRKSIRGNCNGSAEDRSIS